MKQRFELNIFNYIRKLAKAELALVTLLMISLMISGCEKKAESDVASGGISLEYFSGDDAGESAGGDVSQSGSTKENESEDNISGGTTEEDNDSKSEEGASADITQGSENGTSGSSISDASESAPTGLLNSTSDINLTNTDGKGKNYTFSYDGKTYTAVHWTDHWKIENSYDINDEADMMIICQALIDEAPIHGSDMVSYRTAEDMVYEWEIHNLAYAFLSDDDSMKSHVMDVDFDPQDQGKSFDEIYYSRTGKELDLGKLLGD